MNIQLFRGVALLAALALTGCGGGDSGTDAVAAQPAQVQPSGIAAALAYIADAAGGTVRSAAARAQDLGMDMDMVPLGNGGVLRAGDSATVQVLRDGQPLAGLAVELRRRAHPPETSTGVWLQTDTQGRVHLALPTAGKWLLRGIDIRRSATMDDTWDSRFATLAFEVAPPTAP